MEQERQRIFSDNEIWEFVQPHDQKPNDIWIVRRGTTLGYFKFGWDTLNRGVDYTMSRLAWDMGLPTPEVCLAQVQGMSGLVSVSVPLPHGKWVQYAPNDANYSDPEAFLTNVNDLLGMFVFDVWVGNTDRHGENFMLHTKPGGKFELWPIDHGHCLSATTWVRNYDHATTRDPDMFFRKDVGLKNDKSHQAILASVKRFEDLLYWVQKAREVTDNRIGYLQSCLRAQWITEEQATAIQRIIEQRGNDLVGILKPWYHTIVGQRGPTS
jgi:hypothetical protein